MKDLDWAAAFLGRFAIPLSSGGMVSVGVPLLQKGAVRLLRAVATGLDGSTLGVELAKARQRHLRELGVVAEVPPLSVDRESLLLLAALHDALFLFHPRGRELSASRRAGLLQQIRRQLITAAEELPEPSLTVARDGSALSTLLGRYSLLAGLWTLRPATQPGSPPSPPTALETEVLHAPLDGAQQPLLRYLGLACPLLLLLRPPPGPLLLGELLPWLQLGQVTRLFVTGQLRYGTAQALTRVGSALLHVLDEGRRPQSLVPAEQLKTLLGVYCLLHLRAAVSEGEPPAPSNPSDEPLRDALALYASLASQWPQLVTPRDVLDDAQLTDRVRRYQKRCAEQAGSERLRAMHTRCAAVLHR